MGEKLTLNAEDGHKLAAYRVNWFSVDTAMMEGAAVSVLSGSRSGPTVR